MTPLTARSGRLGFTVRQSGPKKGLWGAKPLQLPGAKAMIPSHLISAISVLSPVAHLQRVYNQPTNRLACRIVVLFLLALNIHSPLAKAAGAPALSAIAVSATPPGTAVFSWQTDMPSTSQVVFLGGDGAAVSASQKDTALVTTHHVSVKVVPGVKYAYYVASEAQGAGAPSAPGTFAAPPVNATAPEDYRLDTNGANAVYEGYDLYIGISAVLLGGNTAHLTFDAPVGLPAGATFHVICTYNTSISNEQADSYWDSMGRQWCYNGNNSSVSNPVTVRVRTSPTTPLGQYSVTIRTEAGGIERDAIVGFTVLGVPQPPVRQAAPIPPIPGVATWQQNMTSLGQKWCNPFETMAFGYEPQIWYYDGGRTYFQLSDYSSNPSQWVPCAVNIVNQYRDYVLQSNGVPGWRVFPHGLAMNYWLTGDPGSRDAVMALANKSAYSASSGNVSITLIRETAYLIEALTLAERLGAVHDPRLDRAVAFGLGHFNQLFSAGNRALFDQPAFDGLMAEALIEYYEFSHDPRIPDAIRQMLDWVWTYGWNTNTQQMVYNMLDVPANHTTDLNSLIAPAYAWYWALTGTQIYQQRGDELFAAVMALDISYSGKIFNQNYRWTFDYVNWRTTGIAGQSVFLAGSSNTARLANQQPKILAVSMAPSVTGGGSASAQITLSSIPTQSTQVGLSLTPVGSSPPLTLPASISVPAGSQSVTFTMPVSNVSQMTSTTVVASLSGGTAQATTIIVPSAWGKVDIANVYVSSTYTKVGTIVLYLTDVAPVGGIPVTLTSSNPTAFPLPASVVIPAGVSRYELPVTVGMVSATTGITVQGKVISMITRTTQVLPPPPVDIANVYVSATYTKGGTIVLYLTDVAPAGGIQVTLTSSNPTAFTLPATVRIPAGVLQYSVPVTVGVVSATTSVTVQGKVINTITRTTQVLPPPPVDIANVYVSATYTKGAGTIVLYLTAVAPAGGIPVTLTSSNPTAFAVPARVVIPAGVSQYEVPVTVGAVSAASSVTVQGKVINTITRTTQVLPPPPVDIANVYVSATYTKGAGTIVLYLTAVAPAGGIPVTLTSSNPTAFAVPARVVIPAGVSQYEVPVTVGVVSAASSVTVQGKVINTITRTTQVLPPPPVDIANVYVLATYTKGAGTIVLYLTAVAPAGGIPVTLTSSNPTAFAVPARVVIPAGVSQYEVPVTVGVVSAASSVTVQGKVINTIT